MLLGIRTSSTFNVVMTIVNVFVLLFYILVGASRIQSHNWIDNGGYVPKGPTSIFKAAGTLYFSYLGFDMVSSLSEETKNAQKNIPRGIIGSLMIAVSIYVGISLVSTGMVPYLNLVASDAPLATSLVEAGLGWAAKVISIGSLLGLTTTTFTCLLGQPRIFYTMARDVSSMCPACVDLVGDDLDLNAHIRGIVGETDVCVIIMMPLPHCRAYCFPSSNGLQRELTSQFWGRSSQEHSQLF